ncbi:RNA polymerase factor sigma-54 [Thermomonas haemolytica]|uniref:RNA polymerase sigma-54 factor n=1 Tax=Thermomonas haemolytica TaxID=141949 RepID=A0A4R3N3F3_9GAMM|nr:RNA polymerase factor sigma-54 [Thermomonas haemolytica]TCT23274.1 RNA polymerase RpoN-/SigL-like sigma 54 subunit [Thermomonas haemolytica]TNY30017.1 RNA polymerase sigma-54 factor [Thermomonas haemolytica]
MKASLQAKMGQQMALTPQLLQSIRLLQVTSLQLEQELQQLLERNPLLEQEPEDEPLPASAEAERAGLEAAAWDELPEPMFLSGGGYAGDPDDDPTARIAAGQSSDPRQRLLDQMALRSTPRELALAAYWLDCCDDRGYLEGPPDALAAQGASQLREELAGVSADELLAARQRLLDGEWPGMAAADPRECLLAQLRALPPGPARTLAMQIVSGHLDLLARHDQAGLAAALGATSEEIAAAVSLVLSLQPHPVEQPPEPEPAYIVPDVIAWRANGGWQVRLNTRSQPRLRLCAYAEQAASGHEGMRGLLEEARWMLRSLGIRNETLLKTARVLVARQQAFLEHGEESIAPLTLKDVAEEIGMHESTVSRITTGKYIQTPRGTLELKQLFAVRLEGADVSGAAIKAMVRRLIESEPAHAPLADDAIAALLARQGIRVARRTVAKYREQLAIAPARERKRAAGGGTRMARAG